MFRCLYMGVLSFLAVFCVAPFLYADIYMYVDKNGIYHFTDIPPSSDYTLFIKEQTKKPAKRQADIYNKFDRYIKEASQAHDISFHLVKAIMKVESNFNPQAVSHKGAQGLMQIMPENFRNLHISDPFDPRENIMGGTRYLKSLLTRFNGNLELAIAAYNAGPERVEQCNTVPPIKETQNFVEKVLKYYHIFREG